MLIAIAIKPLKGRSELRLRVVKYRILFKEDIEKQVYVITVIGSHGNSELTAGWALPTLRRVEV
ncbi:MAG: hypothetical protein RI580_12905 [Halothece sp. Uz-M2-17]|nr:hypothetical protein [Halothece sp. Uz-M2-17]